MPLRSIGNRLTLFQLLVIGTGVALMMAVAYRYFVSDIKAEHDRRIRDIAEHLDDLKLPDRIDGQSLATAIEKQKETLTFPGDFPWLFVSRGDTILFGSDRRKIAVVTFDSINVSFLDLNSVDTGYHDVSVWGESYRCYRVSINDTLRLTVIYSWDDLSGPAQRTQLIVAGMLVVLLVILGFGNFDLTRRALKPVGEMLTAMNAILNNSVRPKEYGELMSVTDENPSDRDEITELRETFAQVLQQLHDAATNEYQFMVDTAHDLANPLTVLRTDLEIPTDGTPEEMDQAWRIVRQLDEIQQLSSDLMLMAHFGLSGGRQSFVPVSLNDVLLEETAEILPRSTQKSVALRTELTDEELICLADRHMLRRVIRRVLENIVSHVARGSCVRITVSRVSEHAVVTVEDLGLVTDLRSPEDARESESTKVTTVTPSSGSQNISGLSITREIVSLQGGSIEVSQRGDAGTRVTLRFPLHTSSVRLP